MSRTSLLLLAVLLLFAAHASAEVKGSAENGFEVTNVVTVGSSPEKVYSTIVERVGDWWNSSHSYSGDAQNLSIDPAPGGCFCERLPPSGGVRHMTVVYAAPGKLLRLSGGLGPLQELAVTGSLTWMLAADGPGTKVDLTYRVAGYRDGGLAVLAPLVDGVLREQLERMKRFVETGRAEIP